MAIGNDLGGAEFFTPAMRARGVNLFTSGATDDLTKALSSVRASGESFAARDKATDTRGLFQRLLRTGDPSKVEAFSRPPFAGAGQGVSPAAPDATRVTQDFSNLAGRSIGEPPVVVEGKADTFTQGPFNLTQGGNARSSAGPGGEFFPEALPPNNVENLLGQETPFFPPATDLPNFADPNLANKAPTSIEEAINQASNIDAPPTTKSSPFGPDVSVLPAEQAQLKAQQLEEKGGFLSGLAKAFGSPAGIKFFANLGGDIDPRGLGNTGQFAIDQANQIAEDNFQGQLNIDRELGRTPDFNRPINGLTTESRQNIAKTQSALSLAERQEQRLQGSADIRASAEERLAQAHPMQMSILRQRLATGEITLEEARAEAFFANELRDSGAQSGAELLQSGASILGLELPSDANLDAVNLDNAFELLMELSRTNRAVIGRQAMQKAPNADNSPEANATRRGRQIASINSQRVRLLQKQQSDKGLNSAEVRLLLELDEEMQSLGGQAGVDFDLSLPIKKQDDNPLSPENRLKKLR